jgi:hypothetical protein
MNSYRIRMDRKKTKFKAKKGRADTESPEMRLLHHAIPLAVLLLYVLLAASGSNLYLSLAREDYWVEWLTFSFFAAASVAFSAIAIHRGMPRGWFSAGLAVFCFLVAGEEVSWGNRLFGFIPPEFILEKNTQQELNIHNLLANQATIKWLTVFMLAGWGIFLPLLRGLGSLRKSLEQWHVVIPPLSLWPWFAAGAVIHAISPVPVTAEYMELLTGTLFLMTALSILKGTRMTAVLLTLTLFLTITAIAFDEVKARTGKSEKIACASAETGALGIMIQATNALGRHSQLGKLNKRAYIAAQEKLIPPDITKALEGIPCTGLVDHPLRREYLLDPWAQPYRVLYKRDPKTLDESIMVYSFGPNRRQDMIEGRFEGTDDIGVTIDVKKGKPSNVEVEPR